MRGNASAGQVSFPTRRKLQVHFGPAVAERRLLGARHISGDRKSALTGGQAAIVPMGTKYRISTTSLPETCPPFIVPPPGHCDVAGGELAWFSTGMPDRTNRVAERARWRAAANDLHFLATIQNR